jgi:uncharacterized integral membrane protein
MSDIDPSKNSEPPQKRLRRASRYQRVQARKAAQKASDQRFYNAMFTMIGIFALLAVLLGAIMLNGAPTEVTGMEGWTTPWLLGFTKLEVAGFAFVGFITIIIALRLRKKR